MSKVTEVIERARGSVDPNWDDARVALSLALLHQARRRRAARRVAATAGALVLAVLAGAFWVRPEDDGPLAPAVAQRQWLEAPMATAAVAFQVIGLDAHAEVALLSPEAQLHIGSRSERLISVELRRGTGRFRVTRVETRTFQVQVGDVTLEVLGTTFTVTRQPNRLRLEVAEGQVLARWSGESRIVDQGEGVELPLSRQEAEDVAATPPEALPEASAARPVTPRLAAAAWQAHARQGDFGRAYRELKKVKRTARPRGVTELLLAADAARLSGHPAEAVPYLQEVMRQHRRDARAALASFTLGRVYLNELREPRLAAAAFAGARALDTSGSLAEDALAREVEAWSAAGDSSQARRRAEAYLADYPEGRRLETVRRLGGIP